MAKREAININWAYQNAISYSQYSMYSQCQYQWYLSYVKKQRVQKPSIHLIFGTTLHEVMQEYLTVMFNDSIKAANALDVNQMLMDRLKQNYKEQLQENENKHFSSAEELQEFYTDGVAIMDFFKKNRQKYFSTKNVKLIGVEVPLLLPVSDETPNIFMNGYIDLVTHDSFDDSYTVYDIKTSTRGWKDTEKRDQLKMHQLLFYKNFFSKKMNVPEEKVNVRFFICKRKIFENADFPSSRIQMYTPAQGTKKVKDAVKELTSFVSSCFDEKGKHVVARVYEKNTSACKYCPFSNRLDLCDKGQQLELQF